MNSLLICTPISDYAYDLLESKKKSRLQIFFVL